MSGVIVDGVQYEHCCQCGKYVKLSELVFGEVRSDLVRRWPEPEHDMLDLCTDCAEPETDPEAELQLDDDRWDEAYMRACERDSPNAPDFNGLRRRIYEQLCEENWHAA